MLIGCLLACVFFFASGQSKEDEKNVKRNTRQLELIKQGVPAEQAAEIALAEFPLTEGEKPKDDPKVRKPDITKAREILGWEPKVSRAEGMKRTLEYFLKEVKVD